MTDLSLPELRYSGTYPLKHGGDCSILGVMPNSEIQETEAEAPEDRPDSGLRLYVEEIYGEEGWVAQHCLSPTGEIVESIDEDEGRTPINTALDVPDTAVRSASGWQTMWLNFAGPRHRGMRALERIDELVRTFSIQDKIRISTHPAMNLPAPQVLGLAESYVLAETKTRVPGVYFVCRRLRIAHLVGAQAVDEDGEPYDYDTRVLYLAHFAARNAALDDDLATQMQALPGVNPERPMDCVIAGDHLVIADGGAGERVSRVHVWQVEYPFTILTDEEKLLKRIYG